MIENEYLVAAVESALRTYGYRGDDVQPMAQRVVEHLSSHGWVIAHLDDPIPDSPSLRQVMAALVRSA